MKFKNILLVGIELILFVACTANTNTSIPSKIEKPLDTVKKTEIIVKEDVPVKLCVNPENIYVPTGRFGNLTEKEFLAMKEFTRSDGYVELPDSVGRKMFLDKHDKLACKKFLNDLLDKKDSLTFVGDCCSWHGGDLHVHAVAYKKSGQLIDVLSFKQHRADSIGRCLVSMSTVAGKQVFITSLNNTVPNDGPRPRLEACKEDEWHLINNKFKLVKSIKITDENRKKLYSRQ